MHRKASYTFSAAVRLSTILSLCFLLTAAGCKTSEDATAAATQMTETAKALTGYYATLHKEVEQTTQLQPVLEVALGEPHDDLGTKAGADALASIGRRQDMAEAVTGLADAFTSLTSSDAADKASTSAASLQTELESVKKFEPASPEIDALAALTGPLINAIKQRKEREAARSMSAVATALDAVFKKEMGGYDSLDSMYIRTARRASLRLLQDKQVDESWFFKDALKPFGMAPNIVSPDLKAKVDLLAQQQIESKTADHIAAFHAATTAMDASLVEMSRRIDLVANDKPMALRALPESLASVRRVTGATQ